MTSEYEEFGFHTSQGLFWKRDPDNIIHITKINQSTKAVEMNQIESIESLASALAYCTKAGDTAEQHKKFVDLLNS